MSYTPPPPPPEQGGPPTGAYGVPPGAGAPRQDTKAVLALVLGIASLALGWCCPVIGLIGIAAIVLGRSSRRQIAASGGTLTGAGMAKAGFVLGVVGTGITLIVLVVSIVLLVTGAGTLDFYLTP